MMSSGRSIKAQALVGLFVAGMMTAIVRAGVNNVKLETSPSVFDYTGKPLAEPVWVDLLTGRIYEVPQENCKLRQGGCLYVDIPVYDSPCLLTE